MSSASAARSDARHDRVLAEVERLLGGPLQGKRLEKLGTALDELHRRFVSELPPEPGPPYLRDATALAAYLSWFFPASAAQVERALAEVQPPQGDRLRLLDIGSGPGPASVGVARWAAAHGRSVDALALEASSEALASFEKIWSSGRLETRRWKAGEALPEGPFDVIVASHVLNELFLESASRLEARTAFCLALAKRLSPGGLLVLVEPALKRTGRELLVVRDRLLGKNLSALAPCFFQGACPAISRPRDWCHADRPWTPPEWSLNVGRAAGLARGSLKYAYVILSNAAPPAERTKDSSLYRIVSEPQPEKGKKRFFGCGPSGRHALVRLDRDRTETNASFDTLERGDVVRLEGLVPSGDGRRLGPETPVERVLEARSLDVGDTGE